MMGGGELLETVKIENYKRFMVQIEIKVKMYH